MGKGQDSKATIMEAAIRLVGAKGLDKVSFRQIAEESGYSQGGVMRYFQHKESLVIELFEYVQGLMVSLIQERINIHDSAHIRLLKHFQTQAEFAHYKRIYVHIYLAVIQRSIHVPEIMTYMEELTKKVHRGYADYLLAAEREGDYKIQGKEMEIAHALHSYFVGLVVSMIHRQQLTPEKLMNAFNDLLILKVGYQGSITSLKLIKENSIQTGR